MTWDKVKEFCDNYIIGKSKQIQNFIVCWKVYAAPCNIYLMDDEDPNSSIMMEWHLPGKVVYRCEFLGTGKIEAMTTFPIDFNTNVVHGEFLSNG